MAVYTNADKPVVKMVAEIVEAWHPELVEAGVTFLVQMAISTSDEPPLKFANWPALALVKVIGQKDRAAGLPDVRIALDGDKWGDHTDNRQRAILDHECRHIEVLRNRSGQIKEDDCGRPKLRIRPHDYQMGGFYDIIERYELESVEAEAANFLFGKLEQQLMEWAK